MTRLTFFHKTMSDARLKCRSTSLATMFYRKQNVNSTKKSNEDGPCSCEHDYMQLRKKREKNSGL